MKESPPQTLFKRPYCRHCGYPALPSASVCTECGKPVRRIDIPHPASVWAGAEVQRVTRTIWWMNGASIAALLLWAAAVVCDMAMVGLTRVPWIVLAATLGFTLSVLVLSRAFDRLCRKELPYRKFARRVQVHGLLAAMFSVFALCLWWHGYQFVTRDGSGHTILPGELGSISLFFAPSAVLIAHWFWLRAAATASDIFRMGFVPVRGSWAFQPWAQSDTFTLLGTAYMVQTLAVLGYGIGVAIWPFAALFGAARRYLADEAHLPRGYSLSRSEVP